MEEAFLPEEIIVFILTFLSVKSLIRFTCVSKRFSFIILSDPEFAKSHLKAASDLKTLTPSLLLPTTIRNEFESIDLDTSLFGDSESSSSSVRKLSFPTCHGEEKVSSLGAVSLLDSINGIVFLAFDRKIFYMWNPCIGFFKRLPDLGLSPRPYNGGVDLDLAYGVGYLPATDDYIFFIYCIHINGEESTAALFSTRNNTWKMLQDCPLTDVLGFPGILFKEALHWVNQDYADGGIEAFDLRGNEEGKFREMYAPEFEDEEKISFSRLGVSPGGCLSLVRFSDYEEHFCIEAWVMREYNVEDSWNKILNLKLSIGSESLYCWPYTQFLLKSYIMVAKLSTDNREWVIRINQIDPGQKDMLKFKKWIHTIQYEETLIRIDD